ncbi:glycoside hydrolase family 65 protein [Lactococcus formosensis]|uniref:Glycoside hydrolase family 65 protein n=1 Tax=Lactococcus formosensis TaxID=1281486 RepID=A0A9X4P4H1_9LACT|nr:glycoside hydrolase family 65 protein [Lactococcus formosensis]MDG6142250.1 glycoside hydrolase family 65 protein [Lactococcus formosensis]MDG6155056.1 glycoside hydrolase family 65 protein [Lactococcus formosensis]MDG6159455.1 glycoside hydrolase family 65 protein [Lactococcus formosensis]MDG6165689.1 glycoside hydrolase family 65 protein [Lactococcus formosensis]MDG6172142.1 glycoside hydrolase family 65 protein [Lactococcus formosensis]
MKKISRIMEIDPWHIQSNKLEKKERRLQESLTSIGNGYMGMRGNFSEKYSGDHHQGTYIAGVWFPDKTRVGWWKNGYPEYFGKAINALNFSGVSIFIDDEEVDLYTDSINNFNLSLDMQKAVLSYSYEKAGVAVTVERFMSIVHPELAVFSFKFSSVDGESHKIRTASFIDADVHNEDSNYEEKFWTVLDKGGDKEGAYIANQTIANPFGVEQFTVLAGQNFRGDFQAQGQEIQEEKVINYHEATVEQDPLHFEKRVLVLTSRDYSDLAAMHEALAGLNAVIQAKSYAQLLQEHEEAWGKRWELADVEIKGSDQAQQGIRFNLFQLFATYYGEDERLNIGPKGFTGEKYGGATYWDTEAYAVPLYLSLSDQQVTQNLLRYRHKQLPQAQHNARQQGLDGALYPMVTFTGVECHNEWEITFEEIHRNGAIAYAIYNYSNYTGDETYLAQEGLEVLVEIARFWADRVHYSERQKAYMIHGVTGPNEYENNINNNWYTNTLATWVLNFTMESLKKYPRPDLQVSTEELAKWNDITAHMYYPTDKELGIFVQHDGFLDKDLTPVADLDSKHLPLNQNWSWDRILRSPYIKQADVLQGIYFFGNHYSLEEKRRNFNFYEPLTVHESSLSPSIHAILAAELGMEDKAVEMYERTARLDLDNYNNDTEDGLHITSMTGSWLAIVQGFAQMKTWDGQLSFAPFIPKAWTGYSFRINYRNRLIKVSMGDKLQIELLKGETIDLEVYGKSVQLKDTYEAEVKHV